MKFTLEIQLGNESMQTYGDIKAVLDRMAKELRFFYHETPQVADGGGDLVRDANGNRVGEWKIVADAPETVEFDECSGCGETNESELTRYKPDPELAGGMEAGRCLHCGGRYSDHRLDTMECIKQPRRTKPRQDQKTASPAGKETERCHQCNAPVTKPIAWGDERVCSRCHNTLMAEAMAEAKRETARDRMEN